MLTLKESPSVSSANQSQDATLGQRLVCTVAYGSSLEDDGKEAYPRSKLIHPSIFEGMKHGMMPHAAEGPYKVISYLCEGVWGQLYGHAPSNSIGSH